MIRRTFRGATAAVAALLFIYTGFAIMAARMAVYPWWYNKSGPADGRLPPCTSYQKKVYVHCYDPRQNLALDYTEFNAKKSVAGRDLEIKGWWIYAGGRPGEERGSVILVHGGGVDRRAMLKHAKYLHDARYHVFLIDCHNHGLSSNDGRGISFGVWESESVIAAAEWVIGNVLAPARTRPIIAMGTSQGAFAALRAASRSDLISAVVAENPYVSLKRLLLEFPAVEWMPRAVKYGSVFLVGLWVGESADDLDARRFAPALAKKPVLLIHGDGDKLVSWRQSEDILGALAGPPEARFGHKELWVVKDGEHEALWNIEKERYQARVLRFLDGVPSGP